MGADLQQKEDDTREKKGIPCGEFILSQTGKQEYGISGWSSFVGGNCGTGMRE